MSETTSIYLLGAKFDEALTFTSKLHRRQRRKGTGVPYVSHLLAVTALVIEDGGGEAEAIAALLHDSIEDEGDTYPGGRDGMRDEIKRRFGADVLDIVNACTDDEGHEKGAAVNAVEDVERWKKRKQAYLDHFATLGPSALQVAAADKVHNARCLLADYRSLGEELWSRFRTKSADDQLWYYRELCAAFRSRTTPLAVELCRTVAQLHGEVWAHEIAQTSRGQR